MFDLRLGFLKLRKGQDVYWASCKDAFTAIAKAADGVVHAPEDCRAASGLGWMLAEVRRRLGQADVTIDLSRVRRMNSALLATILLLIREATGAGRRVRFTGADDEFCNWARTFGILDALESRGVLSHGRRSSQSLSLAEAGS